MADETNDQQLVQNAIDFLGKRQPISLTGTTALPTNTALGIPAPSNAPGGLSGFGGGGGPGGGISGPSQRGGISVGDIGDQLTSALKRLGGSQPDLGTRGNVGGEGTPQISDTSLSDRLRTGFSPAAMSFEKVPTDPNALGAFTDPNALGELSFGETGAGGAGGAAEGAAASGLGDLATSLGASGLGALVGAVPGLIGQFAGADPSTQAGLQVGGTVAGSVATPAIAGALGAGGTAGGAAGAGAGLAAAGPGLIAAAPVAAGFIADQVAEMLDTKQAAYELGQRVKNIGPQLPGELEQLNSIPAIAAKITSATTPEEAKALMEQLNKIYTGFEQGGWESYAKQGQTTVGGGSAGKDVSAKLPGVQSALEAETPNLNAGNVARMRLEDIMGKAGMTPDQIPGYLDPVNLALMLNAQPGDAIGNEAFTGAPGPLRGALLPGAIQDIGNFNITGPVTGAQAKALGLDPNVTYSPQDIQNYLLGAGQNTFETTPYGVAARSVYDPLAALQPGNLEAGITKYLQDYGGVGPEFAGFNLGGGAAPAIAPVDTGGGTSATGGTAATTVAQQAIDALGGQSGTPTDLSDFMLSDEQLKAMGMR